MPRAGGNGKRRPAPLRRFRPCFQTKNRMRKVRTRNAGTTAPRRTPPMGPADSHGHDGPGRRGPRGLAGLFPSRKNIRDRTLYFTEQRDRSQASASRNVSADSGFSSGVAAASAASIFTVQAPRWRAAPAASASGMLLSVFGPRSRCRLARPGEAATLRRKPGSERYLTHRIVRARLYRFVCAAK